MGRGGAGGTGGDEDEGGANGEGTYASVCWGNGDGSTVETKEDGAAMEGLEPENEAVVTKGERDEKSIVAVVARDCCCCCCCMAAKFWVNADRTEGESVADLVGVPPPGVGVPRALYDGVLFAGVDNCDDGGVSWGDARAAAAGGEETMTVGGDEEGAAADTGAAAWFGSGAPLLPFVVIREEPDVAFGDGPLAVDGDDLVAPREDE